VTAPRIDFAEVADAAKRAAYDLVPRWLPAGRPVGVEWVCGGTRGEDGESCSINLTTGKWADFATDQKGGDLIGLLAAIRNIKQIEAAREIMTELGIQSAQPASEKPKPKPVDDALTVVRPCPADLDFSWCLNSQNRGQASKHWEYRDDAGRLHLLVVRWDFIDADGKPDKYIRPYSTWKNGVTGKIQWESKHLPAPRPLYGHDRLADNSEALIVVCEGEKAADACEVRFPHVVAICSEGGCSSAPYADWSALAGRNVAVWPDADKPGAKYLAAAVAEIKKISPASLQIVNLDLLQRAINRPLIDAKGKDGFDAADLLPTDSFDLSAILVPVEIAPAAGPKSTPTDSAGAAPQPSQRFANKFTGVMDEVRAYLDSRNLAPDALDGWRDAKSWSLVREDLAELGLHAWCKINASGTDVPKTTVTDILNTIADDMREKRRQSLIDNLAKGPATPEGVAAVESYLKALTGHCHDWELAVIKHWIWSVKRSALMLPVEHHLMPVAYGPQGSGKSVAVNRLCQPWSELAIQINADYLTDDRRCPVLATAITAVWDEMQGSAKADIEALKNMVTSSTISYRPMRTTQTVVQPRTCSFFGTSNLPVSVMVPDTTGARRFVQLDTPKRCEWNLLNDIIPELIWQCVSVEDKAPILPFIERLREHQSTLVHRDQVSQWLEAETWGQARIILSHESEPIFIDPYNHDVGESFENVSLRYHAWSRLIGQAPLSSKIFATRLKQEGFEDSQPRIGGKRTRMYKRPVDQLSQNEPMKSTEESYADTLFR
jgi:hypothetical protein